MNEYTNKELNDFIKQLEIRFKKNMHRHNKVKWENIFNKLTNNQDKLKSLYEMEKTGGEPDVILYDKNTDTYTFYDCSKETPLYRRSICYDKKALDKRKENKPNNNAVDMSIKMKIDILDEEEYKYLQTLGDFDLKSSSWIKTPNEIRSLEGALFGDKKYNRTFIYHNGASSYYSSRGFRGKITI